MNIKTAGNAEHNAGNKMQRMQGAQGRKHESS